MGVAIRRFLTQLKRHDHDAFTAIPEAIRLRYVASEGQMFAAVKGSEAHRKLRQDVAEDLHALIARFEHDAVHASRSTFQAMVRLFSEQCEVVDEGVQVKKATGGDVMQNPSDPDATYDGHKGAGYQVQLTETTGESNEVQLITLAVPQTAVISDATSLEPVLDQLAEKGLLPEEMLADTSYGSDENVVTAAGRGVDLVSPVPGKPMDPHTLNAR